MTNLSSELKPVATPLFGFNGASVSSEGSVMLKVTLDTRPRHVRVEVDFLVVKMKSAYNAIFGRGLLGKLGGIPSTYHQKLKFPTSNGIGEVMGNQTEARRCYVNPIKAKEPIVSEYEPMCDENSERHEPAEQTKQVKIAEEKSVENFLVKWSGSMLSG
ncbi:hypothetical protein Taro_027702 [Colocasia esculenta]|uniref:Uncharacterized protein n=1 Tax=Colocasia esculenta TaxID=4460 RepID=A0A843VPK4_COLES|nr:hypothetical protein [Colocasia esculenta]